MVELQDIFDINYGNKLDLNKMTQTKSGIHFVGRSSKNNGVTSIVEKIKSIKPYPGGLITVALGGSVLSSFLHFKEFYTGQNIAVLQAREPMQERIKLYYCNVITANAYRFSTCGREANRFLRKLRIPPLDKIPEWVETADIHQFQNADTPFSKTLPSNLETKNWKIFRYKSLFEIERGRGPRKKDLDGTGKTPFITSTDSNNGLTNYTTNKPCHGGNTITVNRNGSVAEAYHQQEPFCSTEDVHVFTPKFQLNQYIAVFLITLIRREKYRYTYGRKWGLERMRKSEIKLPVDPKGNPDWKFMEDYIKSLPYSISI